MSVRPLDTMVAMPKTIDYSIQHQNDINRLALAQERIVSKDQKQEEIKQTKIVEASKDDGVDKDGSNKEKYQKNKNKPKEKRKLQPWELDAQSEEDMKKGGTSFEALI